MQRKALVHICGYNIETPNWRAVALGAPEDGIFGQLPTGLLLALNTNADLSFGTGATFAKDGRSEAAFSRDALKEILGALDLDSEDTTRAQQLLESARLDSTTRNTNEEITAVLTFCEKNAYKKLILVTDRAHAPRVVLGLSQAVGEHNLHTNELSASVEISDTARGGGADKVVVFEPPHIPEDPRLQFPEELQIHSVLPPLFSLFKNPERLRDALADIKKVIDSYADKK